MVDREVIKSVRFSPDEMQMIQELPELKEMVSLLRYSSNNLNQLTKRVHETGRIYDADLEDLRQSHERLWDAARDILMALSKLK